MNQLNIADIESETFSINVTDVNNGICIKILGDIDLQDPKPPLNGLLEKLYTGIIEKGLKELVYDFKELTYLNSTSIAVFAKWIIQLSTIEEDKRFVIKIIMNKDITWQETSLPTLTYLVPGIVTIQ